MFDTAYSPSVRIGARLAAQGLLHCTFSSLLTAGASSRLLDRLDCDSVLRHIVKLYTESDSEHGVVCIVIHIDEFQLYDDKAKQNGFSELLSVIADVMHSATPNFYILPIVSGTSARDVRFLPTEKLSHEELYLDPLTDDAALNMARVALHGHPHLEGILAQAHFRIALADTGGIPRILAKLLTIDDADVVSISLEFDWGARLRLKYTSMFELPYGMEVRASLIALVLLNLEVGREDAVHDVVTINILEKMGFIYLSPVKRKPNKFVIHMPLVQLVQLCAEMFEPVFPPSLLFGPSVQQPWRWQDFEELHAYVQCLRIQFLFKTVDTVVPFSKIFPGVIGEPKIATMLLSAKRGTVMRESFKFLVKVEDVAPVELEVYCKGRVEKVSLSAGVFLCSPGNALFDGRCMFRCLDRAVLVVWQDKHSQLETSSDDVNCSDIAIWFKLAHASMQEWHKKHHVMFLFVTNRRLVRTDTLSPQFFSAHPGLLVVTRAELADYLSPTFVGRGLILPSTMPDL
jgi:hypothetical protein